MPSCRPNTVHVCRVLKELCHGISVFLVTEAG